MYATQTLWKSALPKLSVMNWWTCDFHPKKKHNDVCAFKVQGNNLFKILILIKTEIVEVNPI
jgi:hypothetical protein